MEILIIGGGPAGMMAALEAAKSGAAVTLLEQNEKLGKKLYITGKGRCNLTNACDTEEFIKNVPQNPRFLYSALAACSPAALCALVESAGVPLKTERGRRVFPASDKSSDVIRAFTKLLGEAGVRVRLNTRVTGLAVTEGRLSGVRCIEGGGAEKTLPCDAAVLATGGLSYPSTGSTGDGLRFALDTGHALTEAEPSLTPFETAEQRFTALSGLTLENVELSLFDGKKKLHTERGDLLLTHFGLSGPLILSASALISEKRIAAGGVFVLIDLKPAVERDALDARIRRELAASPRKSVAGALGGLLPARLLSAVMDTAGIRGEELAAEFKKEQRQALLQSIKALRFTVTAKRPFAEAIITRGGVKVRELDPATLESKRVRGLYFAGELIDVDAFTGGYNLQIAWSTGALAGRSAAKEEA